MDTFPELEFLHSLLDPFLKLSHGVPCVGLAGTRYLAKELGLTERRTMQGLLLRGIWPERFLRSRKSFSAEQLIRLLSARVLIAGCGGLGGHVASLLARTGIGAFILCDPDVFEESNLNRQYFCTEKTLGHSKAEACRDGLLDIASYLDVTAVPLALDEDNLSSFLTGADAVADCLDSMAKKRMLEKAARKTGIPYLHGAVARHEGFAFFNRDDTITLSTLYPSAEKDGGNMDTYALTVAGTACIMAALLVKGLCSGNNNGQLFHLDLSLPELERFSLVSDYPE